MEPLIVEIITYMKENVNKGLRIAEVAQTFNYSKHHFSREFKRLTGVSASDYLVALKIEKTLSHLLTTNESVLKSHLSVNYLSMGTFSSTFKKRTGAAPKSYQKNMLRYFAKVKNYEKEAQQLAYHQEQTGNYPENTCQIKLKSQLEMDYGIIFVGLFKKPIPDHLPVAGIALTGLGTCTFERIPPGDYYILACAVEKSSNPLNYFLLNKSLRGKISQPVTFPRKSQAELSLELREAIPEDPAITFNFPKLLLETLTQKNKQF